MCERKKHCADQLEPTRRVLADKGRGEPSNVFGGVPGSRVRFEEISGVASLKSLVAFDQPSEMDVANEEKNP